jgi:hypothetical protein
MIRIEAIVEPRLPGAPVLRNFRPRGYALCAVPAKKCSNRLGGLDLPKTSRNTLAKPVLFGIKSRLKDN